MPVLTFELQVETRGQGMLEITSHLRETLAKSGLHQGIASVFCRHTSCSLVLMENADHSARRDLEAYLNRLAPENDPRYTHTDEGPDDMPSHIKMALTRSSETIPFANASLLLGTWQGLFLWEHRRARHSRSLVLTLIGE